MWHNDDRNRRYSNGGNLLPCRRHINRGIVTFITLLLFATIGTLTWNYEGVQNLVKLSPAETFSIGGNKPTELVLQKAQSWKDNGKNREENSTEKETPKEEIKGEDGVIQFDRILDPLVVDLTVLKGVVAKGAVCLDGSPPGYHVHKGSGVNARNWVVFLEEGAWCESEEACKERAKARLGSSKWMQPRTFQGILSNSENVNPDFFNWNRVFVRYCDGASFSGNVTLPSDEKGNILHYRGESVWEAVMNDLLTKGMKKAHKALLGGCSAGGLSSILHCDKFKAALPGASVVKCMSDAGFFVDIGSSIWRSYTEGSWKWRQLVISMLRRQTFSGEEKIRDYFKDVVTLQNASGTLPKYCIEKRDAYECFFPQYLLSNIKTPLFIVNGGYDWWQMDNIVVPDPLGEWDHCKNNPAACTEPQLKTIQGYRTKLLEALSPLKDSKKHGMFVDACFHHCQASYDSFWSGPYAPHVNNKTASQALGDWYFERSTSNSVIDCPYPCNPTCKPPTRGILTFGRLSFRNWSKRG